MTKFEQLLKDLDDVLWLTTDDKYVSVIDSTMAKETIKEYAEEYARLCLERAANCAMVEEHQQDDPDEEAISTHSGGHIREEHYVCVHKPSITGIELPVQ